MLEKHNRMLVELLSRQHPSGSLAADDLRSLMKVQRSTLLQCLPCSFFLVSFCVIQFRSSKKTSRKKYPIDHQVSLFV
jgi:hypothetical protein